MCHVRVAERHPQRPRRLPELRPGTTRGRREDVRRVDRTGALSAADVLVDQLVVDDVAVHLGERRVPVGDPAQRDDELQQIRVRLLPERFLRLAEQVVQQPADRVGDGVRVEIVVQRVVADAGVEPDFEIVRSRDSRPAASAAPAGRSRPSLPARGRRLCARHHPPASAASWSTYGYMQADVLPVPDGAENHDAGVEAALRDREPRRVSAPARRAREMRLAEHQRRRRTGLGLGIWRQRARPHRWRAARRHDGEQRQSASDATKNGVVNHSVAYPYASTSNTDGFCSAISARNGLSVCTG